MNLHDGQYVLIKRFPGMIADDLPCAVLFTGRDDGSGFICLDEAGRWPIEIGIEGTDDLVTEVLGSIDEVLSRYPDMFRRINVIAFNYVHWQ